MPCCEGARKNLPTKWLTAATLCVTILLITPPAYQNSLINQPQGVLMRFTNASFHEHYGRWLDKYSLASLWGFISAISSITVVFGGLLLSSIADRFSTKATLFLVASILSIIASSFEFFGKRYDSFELFSLGQAIGPGFGWAFAFGLAPVYLSECSPPALRGMTGNMISFGFYLGTLLASMLGLSEVLGNSHDWGLYVVWTIAPALLGAALYFVFPHSPKYLYIKQQNPVASAQAIRMFYGPNASIDECFIEYDEETNMTTTEVGIRFVLRESHLRRGLVISAVAQILSFACGPMVTMSYSTMIFAQFLSHRGAQVATVLSALPLPFLALVSSGTIEKCRRRTLLLYGGVAMEACLMVYLLFGAIAKYWPGLGIWPSYVSVAGIVLNMWISPFGPLPVGLFLVSELTPQEALATSSAACVVISACVNVMQVYIFPIAQDAISFWAIGVVLVIPSCLCLLFLWFTMPETQGKPVNEIVSAWLTDQHKVAIVIERQASLIRQGRTEVLVGGRSRSISASSSRSPSPLPRSSSPYSMFNNEADIPTPALRLPRGYEGLDFGGGPMAGRRRTEPSAQYLAPPDVWTEGRASVSRSSSISSLPPSPGTNSPKSGKAADYGSINFFFP